MIRHKIRPPKPELMKIRLHLRPLKIPQRKLSKKTKFSLIKLLTYVHTQTVMSGCKYILPHFKGILIQ